jgi:hypothetical protein
MLAIPFSRLYEEAVSSLVVLVLSYIHFMLLYSKITIDQLPEFIINTGKFIVITYLII